MERLGPGTGGMTFAMNAAEQAWIQLNGERCEVRAGTSLPELLAALDLPVQSVLVEYNGVALFRVDWPSVLLADGDRLEIIRVVAGG